MNMEMVKLLRLPGQKEISSGRWSCFFTDRVRSCLMLILMDAISFSLAAFLSILILCTIS